MQGKLYINMNASILNVVGYTKCHSETCLTFALTTYNRFDTFLVITICVEHENVTVSTIYKSLFFHLCWKFQTEITGDISVVADSEMSCSQEMACCILLRMFIWYFRQVSFSMGNNVELNVIEW